MIFGNANYFVWSMEPIDFSVDIYLNHEQGPVWLIVCNVGGIILHYYGRLSGWSDGGIRCHDDIVFVTIIHQRSLLEVKVQLDLQWGKRKGTDYIHWCKCGLWIECYTTFHHPFPFRDVLCSFDLLAWQHLATPNTGGSTPDKPHSLASFFTHSYYVFLCLLRTLVPGIFKSVTDVMQDVACCTWPNHLSCPLRNILNTMFLG